MRRRVQSSADQPPRARPEAVTPPTTGHDRPGKPVPYGMAAMRPCLTGLLAGVAQW